MKTAVSVPDRLFKAVEQAAKRLKLSRSKLYATALEEFLKTHGGKGVTEKLNEIYAEEPSTLDRTLSGMQAVSLEPEDW
jgi:metal-responsive CopG/Arc/MetJ family transcriptional regulator